MGGPSSQVVATECRGSPFRSKHICLLGCRLGLTLLRADLRTRTASERD